MRPASVAVATAATLVFASAVWAQFGRGGNASIGAHMARPNGFDGRFQCPFIMMQDRYFYEFSVEGYQVAMNVLLYTMTH